MSTTEASTPRGGGNLAAALVVHYVVGLFWLLSLGDIFTAAGSTGAGIVWALCAVPLWIADSVRMIRARGQRRRVWTLTLSWWLKSLVAPFALALEGIRLLAARRGGWHKMGSREVVWGLVSLAGVALIVVGGAYVYPKVKDFFGFKGDVLALTWCRDSHQIAFHRAEPLGGGGKPGDFIVEVSGGAEKALTDEQSDDCLLGEALSPNGRRLAYTGYGEGSRTLFASSGGIAHSNGARPSDVAIHVFLSDADGGEERQLTHTKFYEFDPIWLPGGETIAYIREKAEGDFDEVVTMNADGSNARLVARVAAIDEWAWSAHGRFLAYTTDDYGVNVLRIRDGARSGLLLRKDCRSPTWAPDELRFACVEDGEIQVVDVRTGRSRPVPGRLPGCLVDALEQLGWSPDGKSIAFGCEGEIWVVDTDGGTLRQVTAND